MYKPFDLSGKVALVTGGNGGIGLGMADALAAAGADVCIWGTNPSKNALALDQLARHGGRAEALVCDVADSAAVDGAMAETIERFGRLDGCFVNAGVRGGNRKSVLEIDDAEWKRVLSVNLDGAFYTLRAAAAHMIERSKAGDPGGRLVATASLAALSGAARFEHYGASKGGIVSVMNALASELGRFDITANSILPGWIETEMTDESFGDERFEAAVLPRVPTRRWGQPEDFGGIAVYLMSAASAYHTGDSIVIDGGYWIF